jgi:hypothetical protein
MKYLRWSLLLVLITGLALSLAACGGSTEATAPAVVGPTEVSKTEPEGIPSAEPTTPPTDTPAPEPIEEEDLDTSALAGLSDLKSYRSTMRLTMRQVQDGEEREQSMVFVVESTSEPKAQHITMSGEGFENAIPGASLEMYVLEDTMYMELEDQWLSAPATEDDMGTAGILTPDTLLEDICGWEKQDSTELNGVKVQHWTINKEDMESCMPPEELTGLGELADAGGDLYVAEDENFIVQMDLFYEGDDLDLNVGETEEGAKVQRVEIHYTMTDVNEPFVIEIPEEALASGALPEDIPVPEDAQELTSMFGMITFTSPTGIQEITEFYKTEMPGNGWSENSVNEVSGMYMLEYAKDSRTASFMISTGDSGETSVVITVQDSNQ